MRRGSSWVIAAALLALLAVPSVRTEARMRSADGLQLRLIVPDDTVVGDRLPIDVSFTGAAPDTFELLLDGALVSKRQVTGMGARGVVSFAIETLLLAEGNHAVQIRAMDAQGRVTIVSGRIKVPGVDLSAPVRIAYPANGIEVSGVVPIRIGLSDSLARQGPYVSFFVDRELKVLRNYPPYEYGWDTSTVANGWHVLEAWTQLPDASTPYKARPVHVNVNNSGGATTKMNAIEDLRATKLSIEMPIQTPVAPAALSSAAGAPGVSGRTPSPASRPGAVDTGAARAQEPDARGLASQNLPAGRLAFRGTARPSDRLAPAMAGSAAETPRGRLMIASAPVAAAPNMAALALPEARTSFSPTIRVRAGEDVASVSRRTGVSAAEIRRLNSMQPSGTLKDGQRLIVPQSGAFSIAMDGTRIAFDVAPRFEHGMAIAPFRSLFEYAGGTLRWYHAIKKVHAVNSTREIELTIGSSRALVNNRPLELERKATIERGRTIVPMSFVGEVLDVAMSYDREHDRLLLQSRK